MRLFVCALTAIFVVSVAGRLFAEALNFFYLDNPVKVQTWGNIYADKLDHLAALAYAMNDVKEAKSCIAEAARYYRTDAEAVAAGSSVSVAVAVGRAVGVAVAVEVGAATVARAVMVG